MGPGTAAAALAATALAAAGAGTGCGSTVEAPSEPVRDPRAAACAGTSTGAETLRADGRPPVQRIERGMQVATRAARALADDVEPAGRGAAARERHEKAVQTLQGQAARLRAVRDQIERGSRPGPILAAARASLEDGDLQAGRRLAEAGVRC